MADDETVVAEAPVVVALAETPPADSTEQTKVELTPEQRVAELEATLEKERNDRKAEATGRTRANERDDAVHSRLDAMSIQLSSSARAQAVLMEHISKGGNADDDVLTAELETIRSETADRETTEAQQKAWDTTFTDYLNDMNEILSDGKGGHILDPAGTEMVGTAAAWKAAIAAKDKVGLERALRLADRAVSQSKQAPAAKADNRSAMEMAPSGNAGAAPTNNETIWRNWGGGRDGNTKMTPEVRAAGKALGYLS